MKRPGSEAPPFVWNNLYKAGNNPWRSGGLTDTARRLLSTYASGKSLLEIGCGTGEDAPAIIKMGFDYHGIDAAEAAIGQAKKRVTRHAARFETADFFRWEAERQFDVIYDKGFYHGLAGVRRRNDFVRRVAYQLRPHGIWISITGSADQAHQKFLHGAIYLGDLVGPAEVYFEILEILKDRYGLSDRTKEFQAWHGAFRRY